MVEVYRYQCWTGSNCFFNLVDNAFLNILRSLSCREEVSIGTGGRLGSLDVSVRLRINDFSNGVSWLWCFSNLSARRRSCFCSAMYALIMRMNAFFHSNFLDVCFSQNSRNQSRAHWIFPRYLWVISTLGYPIKQWTLRVAPMNIAL